MFYSNMMDEESRIGEPLTVEELFKQALSSTKTRISSTRIFGDKSNLELQGSNTVSGDLLLSDSDDERTEDFVKLLKQMKNPQIPLLRMKPTIKLSTNSVQPSALTNTSEQQSVDSFSLDDVHQNMKLVSPAPIPTFKFNNIKLKRKNKSLERSSYPTGFVECSGHADKQEQNSLIYNNTPAINGNRKYNLRSSTTKDGIPTVGESMTRLEATYASKTFHVQAKPALPYDIIKERKSRSLTALDGKRQLGAYLDNSYVIPVKSQKCKTPFSLSENIENPVSRVSGYHEGNGSARSFRVSSSVSGRGSLRSSEAFKISPVNMTEKITGERKDPVLQQDSSKSRNSSCKIKSFADSGMGEYLIANVTSRESISSGMKQKRVSFHSSASKQKKQFVARNPFLSPLDSHNKELITSVTNESSKQNAEPQSSDSDSINEETDRKYSRVSDSLCRSKNTSIPSIVTADDASDFCSAATKNVEVELHDEANGPVDDTLTINENYEVTTRILRSRSGDKFSYNVLSHMDPEPGAVPNTVKSNIRRSSISKSIDHASEVNDRIQTGMDWEESRNSLGSTSGLSESVDKVASQLNDTGPVDDPVTINKNDGVTTRILRSRSGDKFSYNVLPHMDPEPAAVPDTVKLIIRRSSISKSIDHASEVNDRIQTGMDCEESGNSLGSRSGLSQSVNKVASQLNDNGSQADNNGCPLNDIEAQLNDNDSQLNDRVMTRSSHKRNHSSFGSNSVNTGGRKPINYSSKEEDMSLSLKKLPVSVKKLPVSVKKLPVSVKKQSRMKDTMNPDLHSTCLIEGVSQVNGHDTDETESPKFKDLATRLAEIKSLSYGPYSLYGSILPLFLTDHSKFERLCKYKNWKLSPDCPSSNVGVSSVPMQGSSDGHNYSDSPSINNVDVEERPCSPSPNLLHKEFPCSTPASKFQELHFPEMSIIQGDNDLNTINQSNKGMCDDIAADASDSSESNSGSSHPVYNKERLFPRSLTQLALIESANPTQYLEANNLQEPSQSRPSKTNIAVKKSKNNLKVKQYGYKKKRENILPYSKKYVRSFFGPLDRVSKSGYNSMIRYGGNFLKVMCSRSMGTDSSKIHAVDVSRYLLNNKLISHPYLILAMVQKRDPAAFVTNKWYDVAALVDENLHA